MANNGNLMPPWKPGQSGNPKGGTPGRQTKRRMFKEILAELVQKEIKVNDPITGEQQVNKTIDECINIALIRNALAGDMDAIREVRDMLDGKIPNAKPEWSDGARETIAVKVYNIINNEAKKDEATADKEAGEFKRKETPLEGVEVIE